LHPSGVTKSSTSTSDGGKGRKVAAAGWQVTLCDPIWDVISRSGNFDYKLLYPCFFRSTVNSNAEINDFVTPLDIPLRVLQDTHTSYCSYLHFVLLHYSCVTLFSTKRFSPSVHHTPSPSSPEHRSNIPIIHYCLKFSITLCI